MHFWKLVPEVPAELGENTVMDVTTFPPTVLTLHLTFTGWLGSELIECFPVFAVTTSLADEFRRKKLSGFDLAPLELTLDQQYTVTRTDYHLPAFVWLRVHGTAHRDDFGTDMDHKLVVSERVITILRTRTLMECEVKPV